MKNKEFRNMIFAGTGILLPATICATLLVSPAAALLLLAAGALLLGIFVYFTRKRYRRIEELNDYLVRVLAGAESPKPEEEEEGELSILRTNIYKAATTLQYQNELLTEDKVRLAAAIADISHQLKTPLTSMMVMNDLLLEETDAAKREEFLRTQSAQLDRMNWLIRTLLKLSKLDAGTVELKREDTGLRELLTEAIRPFVIQFELREITYSADIAEGTVCCDRNWTVEALQNIIKNCMEHMGPGGKLSVTAEDTKIYTLISISDTGCGICAADLPHIFERFYKGKNAGKDSVGIGLALSKAIIEGECGEIRAESTEGAGTRFEIRFFKTLI
ncbi:MAG: HAMP domain-containing histidine kinase [Lachnospiraceae bacterium]|nr:HAMP domain-containing histidine kinase [Lachnospiraceae bacterium]